MITEDRLRALLADRQVPQGISPDVARRRAVAIRWHRRALTAVVVVVALVVGPTSVLEMRGWTGVGRTSLPYAFAGDGSALAAGPDGWVALRVPGLFMYDDAGALCLGRRFPEPQKGAPGSGLPGQCVVEGADDYGPGFSVGGGVMVSVTLEPVVRADFIEGHTIVHAQVAGLRRFPHWRTLSAEWPLPDPKPSDNILIRGWDAKGKLILSVGCAGGCPAPALRSQPALAPEPGTSPVAAASSSPAS